MLKFISSDSSGIFIDSFSKLSNKALRILYTIGPLTEVNVVLFLRNKRFNVNIFISDYKLRLWRLPIEERACHKTHLSGSDY